MENAKFQPTYSMVESEEMFILSDTIVERLNKISNIFKKPEKSDIDKRIIKAFDLYSQIQKSTEPVVKLVNYTTLLENLLLDKDVKDYVNWKLADRVAFLIGDQNPVFDGVIYPDFKEEEKNKGRNPNSKYVINGLVQDLYDERSTRVHSSKSSRPVEANDKWLLIGHNILIAVVSAFLELESKGITSLKQGKGSLIKCLELMKYDGNTISFEKLRC
ncbi:MAG TPA: hypothetical protein VFV86_07330 [Nitrososphaeraceae archaeon]|nr:hypothetical protein [Nitrososphaeraceae archaeon]